MKDEVEFYSIDDPDFGKVNVMKSEKSMTMSNMEFGGWQETKDGSYISNEAVNLMNRAKRRKQGLNRKKY